MTTGPIAAAARIHDVIERAARLRRDRPTLLDERYTLTGATAEAAVRDTAAGLAADGVRPGDRLMLVGENSVAFAVLLLAASRLGAWIVPVNARLTQSEIALVRDHCRPRTMLFTVEASGDAAAHAAACGTRPLDAAYGGAIAMAPLADVAPEPLENDASSAVAALVFTTGTTGRPKGVMLTHANLLFVAQLSAELRGVTAEDLVYGVIPLAHAFGLSSMLLGSLCAGGAVKLAARFNPAAIAQALAEEGVTMLQGVPAMYARLLELTAAQGGRLPAPQLRYLQNGGAPLDPTLKARVEAAFGVPLHNGYGLTETSPTVAVTRRERPAADDSVGPIIPGVEAAFVDQLTGEVLAAGSVGELRVRGPNVMKGYYRDPEATAAVLDADGWLRTGDLARLSAAGDLYIVGRLKELIIRSGFNVHPPEVEAAIQTHPDVAIAAVVGRQVQGNEEIVAFVQPVAGRRLESMAVARHLEDRLAAYKRPQRWVILAELPASPTGKILKAELRSRAARLDDDPTP